MNITQQQFDDKLVEILTELTAASLLSVPGVYECVAEFFNNDVLEALGEEQDDDEEESTNGN